MTPNERAGQVGTPAKRHSIMKTIMVVFILLIVAFLAGFLPPYLQEKRLENELLASRQEVQVAELRDLAGLAYLQVSQKDYGLAAATTTRFFDRTKEVASRTTDETRKKTLEDMLSLRDKITAELAQADPAALNHLQALYVQTRQVTAYLPSTSQ